MTTELARFVEIAWMDTLDPVEVKAFQIRDIGKTRVSHI